MIPAEAVEAARAAKRARQSWRLAVVFYACTLLLMAAAFVLADGISWLPMTLFGASAPFAVLTFLTGRASMRWAALGTEAHK